MVEGGAILLQSFIDAEYWDEICVETSPIAIGNGVKAPIIPQKYVFLTEHRFGRELKYVFKKPFGREI